MKKPHKAKSKQRSRRCQASAGAAAKLCPSADRRRGGRHLFRSAAPDVAVYSPDERQALALLLLPFLLVAFAIGTSHALKRSPTGSLARDLIAMPRPEVETDLAAAPASVVEAAPKPDLNLPEPVFRLPLPPPSITPPEIELPGLALGLPTRALGISLPELALLAPDFVLPPEPPNVSPSIFASVETELRLPASAPDLAVSAESAPLQGMLLPPTAPEIEAALPVIRGAAPVLPTTAPDAGGTEPRDVQLCVAEPRKSPAPPRVGLRSASLAPANAYAFGKQLAEAARAQTADLVIYNGQYWHIAYPMGDVPSLYGVCTDVVIRAYRAVGIDLQALVQQARIGSGDASIDHRRTETLRRFFAAYGETLPVTEFPEDYWPGDIVTYYRPQNRHSRSHIAIVADEISPSGRPMIIHNRGWGPQIEDALFVDKITGHYRFSGLRRPETARPQFTPAAYRTQVTLRPVKSRLRHRR